MATATATPRETEVTLTLSQEEALYVYGALNKMMPTKDHFDGLDPVYDALYLALDDAGVDVLDGLDYAEVR